MGVLELKGIGSFACFLLVCVCVCVFGCAMCVVISCGCLYDVYTFFVFGIKLLFSRRTLSLRLVYVGCCTSWPKNIDI